MFLTIVKDFLCKLWSSHVRPTLMLYGRKINMIKMFLMTRRNTNFVPDTERDVFFSKENIKKEEEAGQAIQLIEQRNLR